MRAPGTLGWTDVDVGVGAGVAERFWHYLSRGKRCPSLQAPRPCPCVCEKRKLKRTAFIEPHFKCGREHIESLLVRSPLKSPVLRQGSPVPPEHLLPASAGSRAGPRHFPRGHQVALQTVAGRQDALGRTLGTTWWALCGGVLGLGGSCWTQGGHFMDVRVPVIHKQTHAVS